jgi:hypothetical protein
MIDQTRHWFLKHAREKNWMGKTAEALDVILDSDQESGKFLLKLQETHAE